MISPIFPEIALDIFKALCYNNINSIKEELMTHNSSDDAGVPWHSTMTNTITAGYGKGFALPFFVCPIVRMTEVQHG